MMLGSCEGADHAGKVERRELQGLAWHDRPDVSLRHGQ